MRPYILLTGLGFLLVYAHFGEFLDAPNAFMLDTGVDGLKNYFNPMYYLKYDAWSWHFSGMNYPFGEHLIFTDGQPLFTYLLKGLQELGVPVADHIPAIFNLLMFGSVLIAIYLLYGIARHYLLPEYMAIPVAVLIGVFSPQLHRLAGHYALAYVWVIPLYWYLLLNLFPTRGKPRFLYALWLVLALFLCSLIHVYYVMIGSLFVLAYTLVYAIENRKDATCWKRGALLGLVAGITPLLWVKVFLWGTDTITDRPESPYGFFHHITYWEGIFLPMEGPVKDFIDQFADVRPVVGEGWAYVGFIGLLVLLFTLVRWGTMLVQRNFHLVGLNSFPRHFNRAFWAGILLAFFSFGWPFNWGLEFLLDWIPPLKQFRSLGRFAWVIYYVFSMYMAIYFYGLFRLMRQKGLGKLGAWMLFVVLLFWGGEAWIHLKLRKERLKQYEHKNILQEPRFAYREWLQELGYQVDDFQAILPIPAYFIGSEKFYTEFVDYYSTREGMSAAYQTGLPMACGLLSRTSVSQTMELLQIMGTPYVPKTLPERYQDARPLLVLSVSGVNLTGDEHALLAKTQLLGTRENISLRSLDMDQIYYAGDSVKEDFFAHQDTMHRVGENLMAQDSGWIYQEEKGALLQASFEERPTAYEKQGPKVLFEGNIPESGDYEVSVWIEVFKDMDGFPNLFIQEFDPQGNPVNALDGVTRFQVNTYQGFVLSKRNFGVTNPRHRFVISLKGQKISYKSVLIRPVNSHIFQPLKENGLMYNNYYLESD